MSGKSSDQNRAQGTLAAESAARDIVIVGAGPAGVLTALAAAAHRPQLASRLLVLDRAPFPRDKYCAGGLGGRGERILRDFAADFRGAQVRMEAASLRTSLGEFAVRPGSLGAVVRRLEFDAHLVAVARQRGICVREAVDVREVREHADHVTWHTAHAAYRAAIVVGADGVGSVVRRALPRHAEVGAVRAQVLEVDTPRVAADGPADTLHFDLADHAFPGYFWDFPTHLGTAVGVCRGVYRLVAEPRARAVTAPQELAELLRARLQRFGLNLADYKQKRFAERGLPTRGALGSARLMLVGEAAGIDAVTGEGIAQALEYGRDAGRFLAELDADGARDVGAWSSAVRRSRLGRDLAIRNRAARHFYGPKRAHIEALLTPDLLHAAALHFAGRRAELHKLAALPWAPLAWALRHKWSQLLGPSAARQ